MFLNFQTISVCFLRPTVYPNFNVSKSRLLVKALSVVGALFVSALMSLFVFRQKIVAIFRPKKIIITPCDPLLKHKLFHVFFKDFTYF